MSEDVSDKRSRTPSRGMWIENDVMYVAGEEFIERVASALASPTRLRVLGLIMKENMGIEELAEKLKHSKANISTHGKRLEEASLVKPMYIPGHRGIKKIAKPIVREVRILLYTLAEEVERRMEEVPLPPEELEEEG